jgi:bifunctional NMN adenylyltransferase/nudix hydrolase
MLVREGQPDGSQYNVGVIVGRFQTPTLHPAHRALIEHALGVHEKVLVLVGAHPLLTTRNNPFPFAVRKAMLKTEYPPLLVGRIDDVNNDEVWSQHLDREITKFARGTTVLLYGSRDSFIPYYTGKFDTCELERHGEHSATAIRETIARSDAKNDPLFREGMVYAAYNQFPTAYTTVDVGIWDSDERKLLLGQKKHETAWRLVGGFSSPDSDNFESDAAREMYEETGLTATGYDPAHLLLADPSLMRYHGSFKIDDWRYRKEVDKIKTLLFSTVYTGHDTAVAADDLWRVEWFEAGDLVPEMIMPAHIPLVAEVLSRKMAMATWGGVPVLADRLDLSTTSR